MTLFNSGILCAIEIGEEIQICSLFSKYDIIFSIGQIFLEIHTSIDGPYMFILNHKATVLNSFLKVWQGDGKLVEKNHVYVLFHLYPDSKLLFSSPIYLCIE